MNLTKLITIINNLKNEKMKKLLLIIRIILFTNTTNAQWVLTSCPTGSNTVQCFASDGTNIFVGTLGGGVFISTDNGNSWNAVNTGLTNLNVYALAISGTTIFAGLHGGLFKSINNGSSWTHITSGGIPVGVQINAIVTSGTNIYVGANNGVYTSSDSGLNWSISSYFVGMNPLAYVMSLALNGSSIFAGTGNSGYGILKSIDNGSNWTSVNSGIPSNPYISALATNGINTYATCGDFFVSSNYGVTWASLNIAGVYTTYATSITFSNTDLFV